MADDLVLVPRKPTKAMLRAAAKSMSPGRRPTQQWLSVSQKHAVRYRAMINAYLNPTEESETMKTFTVTTEQGAERFTADRFEEINGYLYIWPETGTQPVAVFAPGHWSRVVVEE